MQTSVFPKSIEFLCCFVYCQHSMKEITNCEHVISECPGHTNIHNVIRFSKKYELYNQLCVSALIIGLLHICD